MIEAAGLYGKIAAGKAGTEQVVEQLSILIEADLPFKITSPLEGDWLAVLKTVEALVAGASLDDAIEVMRFDGRERSPTAISGWDQIDAVSGTPQAAPPRHRSGTGRDQ